MCSITAVRAACRLSDDDHAYLQCMGAASSIGGRLWAREHHSLDFEQHHIRTLETIRAHRQ